MSLRAPHMAGKASPGTLLLGLMLALIALGGVWLSSGLIVHDAWQIRWVQVDGRFERVSAHEVRAAIASHVDAGFFGVDLDAIRRAAEGLPWVAHALVRKRWPDTLQVRVREHRPMARWSDGRLIDRHGRLFRVDGPHGVQGLPRLSGPDRRVAAVIEQYRRMRELLAGTGLEIVQVHLSERGAWRLEVDRGFSVRLGRDATGERLQRFAAVWDSLRRQREAPLTHVDLRYRNGLAVSWAGTPAVAASGES